MSQFEIERLLSPYPDMLPLGKSPLCYHPRSVQRWPQQGRCAVVRAGRTYRIPRTDVLRWMLGEESTTHAAEEDGCGEVSS